MDPLQDRLASLEKRVAHLEQKQSSSIQQAPAPQYLVAKKVKASKSTNPSGKPTLETDVLGWFKEEPLMKIGAILLILGLAWFVRYAFVQNWVGPIGRIALGIGFGTLVMIFGAWMQQKRDVPGQVLLATGLTVNLVSVYAARAIYDLFTPELALIIMLLFIAGTIIVALMRNKQSIAILALIAGAIAPVLTSSPEPSYIFLLSYIAILNAVAFVLVAIRGWKWLYTIAAIYTVVHSFALGSVSEVGAYIFMSIYAIQFYATITADAFWSHDTTPSELFSNASILMVLLVWITEYTPEVIQPYIAGAIALLLIVVTIGLFAHGKKLRQIAYLHIAASLSYLFAASAFAFEGKTLLIALMIQALGFFLISVYKIKEDNVVIASIGLMLVPAVLNLPNLDSFQWLDKPIVSSVSVLNVVIWVSFAIAALAVLQLYRQSKKIDYSHIGNFLSGVAWVYSAFFVWYTFLNLLGNTDGTRAIVIVLYAILGALLLFIGLNSRKSRLKTVGMIILSVVVLRLLVVDVWNMELAARIGAFIFIGALLMSTAFFQKQLRE
jgi:uncharacterized membrane protein